MPCWTSTAMIGGRGKLHLMAWRSCCWMNRTSPILNSLDGLVNPLKYLFQIPISKAQQKIETTNWSWKMQAHPTQLAVAEKWPISAQNYAQCRVATFQLNLNHWLESKSVTSKPQINLHYYLCRLAESVIWTQITRNCERAFSASNPAHDKATSQTPKWLNVLISQCSFFEL